MTNDSPTKTVEAVARAICLAHNDRVTADVINPARERALAIIVDETWPSYVPEARAAIKAHLECLMNEPIEPPLSNAALHRLLTLTDTEKPAISLSAPEKTDD